ncbi:di-heme oxidoredictase family protein [Bradyrhizobium sp. STM 3843]|uniref:di-heme oxidoredictase family protein n=1 Tax=Bradyrhizobium sp. STM 3843 TaxID=551947 RepID=UPI0002E96980|nr:di-heme oxidoredictase family protein [Bradyrhizobium sp. STM 3843]
MNPRLVISLACALAAGPTMGLAAEPAAGYFGEPALSSIADWDQFRRGLRQFSRVWSELDGVGATFNERSCLACHAVPMPGGAGLTTGTFVFVSARVVDEMGGHVFQRFRRTGSGIFEQPPPDGFSRRKAPPLFGLGLLEKIPQETLVRPRGGPDHIQGRPGGTPGEFGRFGWKAGIPDLAHFVRTAFSVELGFGAKVQEGKDRVDLENALDQVTTFVEMLSPPPGKSRGSPLEITGKELFEKIGCSQCHVSIFSGKFNRNGTAVEFEIRPYTDLLLHDMGPGLSDGISDGAAGGSDFRTPPLWGLTSFGPPYLHDGRADNLAQAIEEHDGEARATRSRWQALQDDERRALLCFLESL